MQRFLVLLSLLLLCPLATSAKSALPRLIVGNWTHVATSKTVDGEAAPLKDVVIRWEVRKGGKGTYFQKVAAIGQEAKRDFTWKLDGKKLILNDGAAVYEVKKYGSTKMIWYNLKNDDYYHVERLDAPKLK